MLSNSSPPRATASPQPGEYTYTNSTTGSLEQPRRTSFSFLRRQRSSEVRQSQASARTASGTKLSRKEQKREKEEFKRRQREAAAVPKQPPRLPSHNPLPHLNTFGAEPPRPDSLAIMSGKAGYTDSVPVPPLPDMRSFDPYPRTESMTHRGRYSYASSAISGVTMNTPRRVRRRRDPTPFK